MSTSSGDLLRSLRVARGLSLRSLAALAHYSRGYLGDIETGRKPLTPETARHLDTALDTAGRLFAAARPTISTYPDIDTERLDYVAKHPRRIDSAIVEALSLILDGQRRLEDTAGAALVRPLVVPQLMLVRDLVVTAPAGLRQPVLGIAGQWAQFGGWLSTTTGDHDRGQAWYMRALQWATEIGDADMIATSLSMRGHLAWIRGDIPAMLELSRAAQWPPARLAVTANAVQQEARAHALLGDGRACDHALDRAEELAHQAVAGNDQMPPWMYFYSTNMLIMQRGLAQLALGRHERAAELLEDGLGRMAPAVRQSDWVGWYVAQLATAHAEHTPGRAVEVLDEARGIAERTRSERLTREVGEIARRLRL